MSNILTKRYFLAFQKKEGDCVKDIVGYNSFLKIEPVNKGWSTDKKYYIETIKGEHLLLRVSDISQAECKSQSPFCNRPT